jgi:hypothetical protein
MAGRPMCRVLPPLPSQSAQRSMAPAQSFSSSARPSLLPSLARPQFTTGSSCPGFSSTTAGFIARSDACRGRPSSDPATFSNPARVPVIPRAAMGLCILPEQPAAEVPPSLPTGFLTGQADSCAIVEIPLTGGEIAIIDEVDAELVLARKWSAHRNRHTTYVKTSARLDDGRWTKVQLHRFLLNAPTGVIVDHINGNGLDNRRVNLRLCTASQNATNRRGCFGSSGLKGARFVPAMSRWCASIRAGGKRIHLGYFSTAEDAHAAYCEAAIRLHGEFARLA